MKTLKGFKKQEVKIPESWNDVTVRQFCKLFEYYDDEGKTNYDKQISIVAILLGISEDDVDGMLESDFNETVKVLSFVNDVKKIPKTRKEFIEIEGEVFYLKHDYSSLLVGEKRALVTIQERAENGNVYTRMNELLCVLLRKKEENGEFEKFSAWMIQRSEMFNNIKVSDVYGLVSFFLSSKKKLQSDLATSLAKRKSKKKKANSTPEPTK